MRARLALFISFLMLLSPRVLGQEAGLDAGADVIVLPEIVVESRKRDEDPKDVPFGVSVITGKEIEERRIRRAPDVVREVPNTGFTGFGDGRSTNFDIRGVGAIGDPLVPGDTSVIVYVDGVPQPIFAADVGFLDLEQVEVLKGPQGTLFGRGTTGCAILLTTNKPGENREFRAGAEAGEQGHRLTSLVASGPLIEDMVSGRLALRYTHLDPFVENTLTDDDLGEGKMLVGRGILHVTPSSRTDVTLSASADHDDRSFPFFVPRDAAEFPAEAVVHDHTTERYVNGGSVTVKHDFDSFDFTSVSGATRIRTDILVEDTPAIFFSRLTGLPQSVFNMNNAFSDWSEEQKTFSQELRVNAPEGNEISWVAGAAYYYSRFDVNYLNLHNVFPGLNGRRRNDLGTNSYSLFGETTLPVGSRLKVTGGGRYTIERKTYDARYTGIGTPGTVAAFREAGELEFDFPTGRGALSYELSPSSTAYISVARGHKTGGFPRLVLDAALGMPTAPFGEAKSLTYETGIKHRSKDGRARLDVAAFHNDVEGEHLLVQDATNFTFRPANIDTVSYGFEVEGAASLSSSLDVDGLSTFMHQLTGSAEQLVTLAALMKSAGARLALVSGREEEWLSLQEELGDDISD